MKILVILLLCVFLVGSAEAMYMFEGSWSPTKCEICGKTVYTYYKPSYSFYSGASTSAVPPLFEGESIRYINDTNAIGTCGECRGKYEDELDNIIKRWLEKTQTQYKDIRLQYEKSRLLKKKKEINTKIKELKEKLERLK